MTIHSICRKMLLLGVAGLSASAFADEWTADAPIESEQMAKLLAQPEAARPEAESQGVFSAGLTLWRCDAWSPLVPGSNFYWISTSPYYARVQALGACQQVYGFNCLYQCQRSW